MKIALQNKFLLFAIMVVASIQFASAQSISYQASYDFSVGATFSTNESVASEDNSPTDLVFSNDGMKVFTIGLGADEINQYALTSAFDISGGLSYEGTYSVTTEEGTPYSLTFNDNGTRFYILGYTTDRVYQYSLSSPFDITSTVTLEGNYYVGLGNPNSLAFNNDGTRFYVGTTSGHQIHQYNLSNAFDVTTGTITFTGSSEPLYNSVFDFQFINGGHEMFVLNTTDGIDYFALASPYDVSSIFTEIGETYSVSIQESNTYGLVFTPTGNRFFIIGTAGDDINQYDFNVPAYSEVIANNGSLVGTFNSFTLIDETFANPGGTLIYNTDYQISNLPAGLTPIIEISSNGLNGTLSFSGAATNHQNSDDVSSLTFTFNNSAFAGGDASSVTNAVAASSNISIDFRNNSTPIVAYGKLPSVVGATLNPNVLDISSESGSAGDMAFNNDGTKLFIIEYSGDNIYEYTLTNPYDISSNASYSGNSFYVGGEENYPTGIRFSMDGLHMYVVGITGDAVVQYSLSSAFDITSTVEHEGSYSVAGETAGPQGIDFSPDGRTMLVSGPDLYIYNLSSPFDITSSVSFIGIYDQTQTIHSAVFGPDGTQILYTNSVRAMGTYDLDIPYSLGTVNSGSTISVLSQDNATIGVAYSPDRKKLFMVGSGNDNVNQYAISPDGFEESFDDNGTIIGSMEIRIIDEQFSNAGGTLTQDVDYSVSGLPAGLTSLLSISDDGATAQMTLSGIATSSTFSDNVSSLQFTFNNTAFVNSNTAEVINAIGADSHISIVFKELAGQIFGSDAYQLAGLTFDENPISVADQTDTPFGMIFNNEGTKMFLIDGSNATIIQYTLTTPYHVATSAVDGTPLDISADETLPRAITFNHDGTKLYMLGMGKDKLHQYTLGTPYNITGTVTHDGDLTFNNGTGITFSSDGSRMFLTSNAMIYQYMLNTPYDITTGASQVASAAMTSANSYSPTFSPNGRDLFVMGGSHRAIYRYPLSKAFDISDGLTYSESFGVASQDTGPLSMSISGDGKTFYVTGGAGDDINVYELPGIGFSEVAANSGALDGTYTFSLIGDSFVNASGILSAESHFNVAGLPDGLLASMTISGDGNTATLSIIGSAANHQDVDDATIDLEISFLDAAFVSGDASAISNTLISLDTNIDFDDNGIITYTPTDFEESHLNEGKVVGSMLIQIANETFTNAGGSLTEGEDYSISNIPEGLVSQLAVAANGLSATLTFSGTALDHQDTQDVTDLVFTFENSAFTSMEAQFVINAISHSSGSSIDFEDNNPSIAYGSRLNLAENSDFMLEAKYSVLNEDAGSGFTFSTDGMIMFVSSWNNQAVYQYNLTTAFDVSSGVSYSGHFFDVSNEESTPSDVDFSLDGTKMYVQGGSDNVNQYSLSSPFDLSGEVNHDVTFDLGNDAQPSGITFSADGTKMYMIGSLNDDVFQYSVEIPFDLTGNVTYDGTPYGVPSYNYSGIIISKNGYDMYLVNTSYPGQTSIRQYKLTEPNDITAGATVVGGQSLFDYTNHTGDIFLTPDGSKLMILANSQEVYQLKLVTDGFSEIASNNGGVEGSLYIEIYDERFTNAGSTMTYGSDYTINNLPVGLTSTLEVAADGFSATLSLSGNAAAHQDANDVVLEFTFNNSAFVTSEAANVANAVNTNSQRSVDFRDNHPVLFYGNGLNMKYATNTGSPLDVSPEETYPAGIVFNDNGTKMFIVGGDNSAIHQYSLSTPYQTISGVTFDGSFDVSTEDEYPEDIVFSGDGSKMYVMGGDSYVIYEYNLSTAFEITTGVSYTGNSLDVNAYNGGYGMTLSPDGTKMYLIGDGIHQFALSTPFDVTNATFETTYSPDELEGLTDGVISPDGRYLLILSSGYAASYILNTSFDISNGLSIDGTLVNISGEIGYASSLAIHPNGNRLFVVSGGEGSDASVHQYEMDLGGFTETSSNNGSVEGAAKIYLVDDTFVNAGGVLTHGVDYNINNLPSGLTATLDVAADGYSATVTLTGNSNAHGNVDDIEGLQFHFQNSAFSNYSANEVDNANNYTSDIGIDYLAYTENDISNFTFTEISGPEIIFTESHAVTAEAVAGTDLSALTPTITISQEATISPNTGEEQDFTSTVIYTVTAEDGTPQDWEVTISEKLAAPSDILLSNNVIDENVAQGTLVGTLSTIDASFADAHSYTFASGTNDNESFDIINGNELVTAEMLDYEESSEWLVDVMTDDGNGGTFTKQLVINLNDINETPTDLLLSNNAVDESSSIGTLVGTLTSTDEDSGDMHIYSFKSGIVDNDAFDIDGDKLITAEVLDFETQSVYNLELVTTDQGGLTYEKVIVVNVNDLPAQITSIEISNTVINENTSIGTLVGTFATFGEALSGSFTYNIIPGSGDDDHASFSISGDQLLVASSFDFESQESYTIVVMSDDGNLTDEQEFTISVIDVPDAPTDILLSASEVAENNATGEVVGLLSTVDQDTGESHTYELVTGEGDTDNTSFSINGNELRTAAVYDFETQASYSVRIETNDGNGGTYQEVFTITILNENESIIVANPIADQSLDEGFETTEIDLSAVFVDQDSDALTYEVSSSNTEAVTVSNTGATLTIAEVGLGTSIVTVTADDGSGITTSDEFTVVVNDVNDAPTDVLLSANEVAENNSIGDVVGLLSTTDPDAGASHTYALVLGEDDTDNAAFSINENELRAAAVYDFETKSSYTVRIETNDGNGGTYQEVFTITILNENEAPIVVDPFVDQTNLIEGFVDAQINYADVFSDDDGDELTITVSSSNLAVVTVSVISNNQIHIDEVGLGTSTITVTANDGRGGSVSDEFIITVNRALSSANDIITFSVEGQIGTSIIDEINHTISLTVSASSDITNLSPELSISDLATINPTSGSSQNFSSNVVYTVTAENGDAQDWTVTVDQMKTQTLSIQSIGEKTYGSSPFEMQAEASSQLEVSFELIDGSNAVTLQGSTITVIGAGSFTVKASQSGNAEYEAQSVQQTFSIQKAPLTVTADNKSRVFGEENPELTLQYAGFVNGDEQTDLSEKPIVTTSAVATSNVGEYDIEVTGGTAANYEIQTVNGVLTISKATAMITLSDLEQDADGSAKIPTVTTDPAGLSHTITYDGSVDAPSEAGTYNVVVTIDEDNYAGEQTASFTINGIATGVEDLALEYKVYPNPAKNWLKIENSGFEELTIRMYNLDGQLVLSDNLTSIHTNLDISDLNNGMYLLSLNTKQYSTTTRILINR